MQPSYLTNLDFLISPEHQEIWITQAGGYMLLLAICGGTGRFGWAEIGAWLFALMVPTPRL